MAKNSHTFVFLGENKFQNELIATAKSIATPGKGILAADESTATIAKRLKAIKLENTRENRRAYRHLLFTTKDIGKYISGAILFEETLYEKTEDGKTSFVDILRQQGVIVGIKVDLGTKHLPGSDNETYTQGITDLDKRCAAYYKQGARFAKWRAVLRISRGTPSQAAIIENATGLALYAAICQANGLVPIVEPEILMDGDHDIATCQYWTEKVLAACFKALNDYNVLIEGCLLKPNMVINGQDCPKKATSAEIARATVAALQRTVPPSLPAVVFLSGGQTEEEASVNLNAMNALDLGARPWRLTFSYGRALQQTAISTWKGLPANVAAAQAAFFQRAKANGEASIGKYAGGSGSGAAQQSLYEKGYVY